MRARGRRHRARRCATARDEIDLVLPYRALLRGDTAPPATWSRPCARPCARRPLLKVILETGELADPRRRSRDASRLAIAAGADFIKTSTGKSPVSATPEAAETMLHGDPREPAGRSASRSSGGIRTLADAATYLALADRIMGPGWASPATFRLGASSLLDALMAAPRGCRQPERDCHEAAAGDHPRASATAATLDAAEIAAFIAGPDRRRASARARPRPSPWRCSSAA